MRRTWFIILFILLTGAEALPANELEKFTDVTLVDSSANDGDSFLAMAGEKRLHLRLYFVDCPESVATTDADAKRVREQAQYFGITDARLILQHGQKAKEFTAGILAKPFTVYTSFANAMGRSPGGRVYAFVVTSEGRDLAEALVEAGMARPYGFKRSSPDGKTVETISGELARLEAAAMVNHAGVWKDSDPQMLAKMRADLQQERDEIKTILNTSAGKVAVKPGGVDLNTATARELQSISGIGPTLATRIIEHRPYKTVDELRKVPGVGDKLLEKWRPFLVVSHTESTAR
jgi:competence ComEA-like helix-hairpin-helix protein